MRYFNALFYAIWIFWEPTKELFGFDNQRASLAFKLFLRHLSENWGYLLLDNMNFWKPHIPQCAEAIRRKLMGEPYNCLFEAPGQEGGFNIFGFVDNTMNATCRPGGPNTWRHEWPIDSTSVV